MKRITPAKLVLAAAVPLLVLTGCRGVAGTTGHALPQPMPAATRVSADRAATPIDAGAPSHEVPVPHPITASAAPAAPAPVTARPVAAIAGSAAGAVAAPRRVAVLPPHPVAPLATASGLSLFERPFADDAPANSLVPADAAYGSSHDRRTKDLENEHTAVNSKAWGVTIAEASWSDPVQSVREPGSHHVVARLRMPRHLSAPEGKDQAVAVVEPDGHSAYEFYRLHRDDGHWVSTRVERNDLRGTGLERGARASDTSLLWGVIRQADLDSGAIDHSLVLGIPNSALKRGPVWPANDEDSDAKHAYHGSVPMGTRFAVPRDVDLSKLHLSRDGRMLGEALQRYGAYVLRRSDSTSLYAESAADDHDVDRLRDAWSELRPLLRPVED